MEDRILGLHHLTAIAGSAKRNFNFYTKVLGLRLLKKTVNFDDPGTYHLYYGNEVGSPGTILTFFPYEGARKGKVGSGIASHIGYSVPEGSFDFWMKRFKDYHVEYGVTSEKFGEKYLPFKDPDGLQLELIIPDAPDNRKGWETEEVQTAVATKGFHSVTLTLRNAGKTAEILTDIFGYTLQAKEASHYRFKTDAVEGAGYIDIIEDATAHPSLGGAGTNHHIAFRVKNEDVLMKFREKVVLAGFNITDKIDRSYFYSLYFREPGGVLFEIATDNPGFSIDEPLEELGQKLLLPPQYESQRAQIEAVLPSLY
jgi:glyoxalase family protein